jgi:hypothetical protein
MAGVLAELIEAIPPQPGKRMDKQPYYRPGSKSEVARTAGVSPRQQATATQVHRIPRADLPTITELAR